MSNQLSIHEVVSVKVIQKVIWDAGYSAEWRTTKLQIEHGDGNLTEVLLFGKTEEQLEVQDTDREWTFE